MRALLGAAARGPRPVSFFNRRGADNPGLLFRRLLEQAVITEPWPLIDLTTEPLDTCIWD